MVVHFAGSAPAGRRDQQRGRRLHDDEHQLRPASTGPLRSTLCFPVPGATGGQVAFRCSAFARSTDYPFEGVVDRTTHVVVYCRHNPPPVPGVDVPLSRRCTA